MVSPNKLLLLSLQDDEVVVVDKPASMPVHPCGRYRHNSVIFILAKVPVPVLHSLCRYLWCIPVLAQRKVLFYVLKDEPNQCDVDPDLHSILREDAWIWIRVDDVNPNPEG